MASTTTVHPCIVAGEPVETRSTLEVSDKFTGQEIGRVCLAGEAELERALAVAAKAAPALRKASRAARAEWLDSIAHGIRGRATEFADTIVAEAGKPLRFARGEVQRAISTFSIAAQEAARFTGEVVPVDMTSAGEGYVGFTSRVGAGPVAAVTPFNFPLNLVAHKLAPAFAVGNPVIHKPASSTPLTALLLGEVVRESGAPPEILSVLPMRSAHAEPLVEDPRVKIFTFTGSPEVGWALKAKANKKKVLLELGGNAPAIVHSDADLEFAASRIAVGGYAYAGQVCISVQRVLVHRPIYEAFRTRYVEAVRGLGVGDPRLEETVSGPMIDPGELERVADWVERARSDGARVLCGGKSSPPVYEPTVLEDVKPEMWVSCKEVFGPVTTLAPYDEFEDALELANDPQYGLQVGVFTRDLERVLRCQDDLEYGGIIVNDYPTFRVDNMPYGGVKESGFGREGLRYTMEEMSEHRLLVIRRGAS